MYLFKMLILNTHKKKIETSFWNIFRPSVVTKNYYGIFVFGRDNENEKKPEKFSPNENYPVFRPSLVSKACLAFVSQSNKVCVG
jgi:hypothetical protein